MKLITLEILCADDGAAGNIEAAIRISSEQLKRVFNPAAVPAVLLTVDVMDETDPAVGPNSRVVTRGGRQ